MTIRELRNATNATNTTNAMNVTNTANTIGGRSALVSHMHMGACTAS